MTFRQIFLSAILWSGTFWAATATAPADSLAQQFASRSGREVLIFANQIAAENPELAKTAFQLALRKAIAEQNKPLEVSVHRDRGIFYEDLHLLDSAAIFFKKSFEVAEASQLAADARTALNDLAIISRKLIHFDDAENYHREALRRATAARDIELEEFSLHGLGFLYENVGDPHTAAEYYLQSYKIAEQQSNAEGMIVTLSNLAGMRAANRQRDSALLHTRHALEIAFAKRDTAQIPQVFHAHASIFEHFGEADSARFYFQKSADWSAVAGDWAALAAAFLNLGKLAEQSGDAAAAESFYRKIYAGHFSMLTAEQEAEVYFRLSQILLARDERSEVLFFLKNAYSTADAGGLTELQIQYARLLFEFFEKQNDTPNALFYLEKANFLSDSLSLILRDQATAALDFRYGLVKKEREKQQTEIRQGRFRLVLVLGFGLLAAVGMGFLVRMRRRTNSVLRQKNEAIREQNVRLEESNKFLHQFTYAVAHDVKEPLRSISGFLSLLERRHPEKLASSGKEYVSFVQQGISRMNNLITDLLNFSQISSQRPEQISVDTRAAVARAAVNFREKIEQKNGEILLPDSMPKVQMKPEHLDKLLQNLLDNALKFNHNEHPTVKIGASRINGHVLISVEDNGIGIDSDHSKKIYELFHQLHKNQPYGGTGVGLTVCKNIVDKYDGAIWFEGSEAQVGTKFWVKLPASLE